MFITSIILLLLGGGTSFAAESALPGDVLYPIKISVNEEVMSFVVVSDKSQAQWDARRVERRLEEAEKLAVYDRLNAKTRADIATRLARHTESFQEFADRVEAKQDHRSSLEIHSNFEAALKAHEQVLVQIADQREDVRGEVNVLVLDVRTRLNATAEARSHNEVNVSAEENNDSKTAAEGKLRAAENKLNEVRGYISRMKSSVSASVNAQAEAKLHSAVEVIARGKAEMAIEKYGKAFASFQEAMRLTQGAKLLIATEERIDFEIKLPEHERSVEDSDEDELRKDGKLRIDLEL